MNNPCRKDCPKRSPTCHCECSDYLEFFEERQRENRERYISNDINYRNAFVDRAIRCAIRARRR